MFSDLGGVHAFVIFDPPDIQQSAVSLPATVHGLRTELLDVQVGPVRYPPDCTGITDKNFELVELNKTKQKILEVSFSSTGHDGEG
jgi:hypothetical protein